MQNQESASRYVFRDGDCYWVKPYQIISTDIDCTGMEGAQFMAFFFTKRRAANVDLRNVQPVGQQLRNET